MEKYRQVLKEMVQALQEARPAERWTDPLTNYLLEDEDGDIWTFSVEFFSNNGDPKWMQFPASIAIVSYDTSTKQLVN